MRQIRWGHRSALPHSSATSSITCIDPLRPDSLNKVAELGLPRPDLRAFLCICLYSRNSRALDKGGRTTTLLSSRFGPRVKFLPCYMTLPLRVTLRKPALVALN